MLKEERIMKKFHKFSAIASGVLAGVMALSMCAFASGDASGETEASSPKTPGETPAEVIMAAFACRNFSDEPLTEDEVYDILAAGANAPSAMNGQPWQFILVEDTELKNSLISNEVATCIIVAVPTDGYNMGANGQFAAGTAAESMYLYAQASGYAANMYVAPCEMIINVSDESKAEFGISSDYEAAIVLGIGHYADEVDAFASASARNDVSDFVTVID
jgi:hypothetical protein